MKKILNKLLDTSLLWRIMRLASPYKLRFYGALLLSVTIALTTILNPYLTQLTIDKYILKGDLNMLSMMLMVLIGVLLFQALLTFSFTYLSWWLGQTIIKSLRLRIFDHIQHLPLRFFDTTPVGTTVVRTINDIETINDIFTEGVVSIIADMLTIVVVLSFMFYQSWSLTLVCLSVLPVLLIGAYFFKEGIRVAFIEVRTQVARLSAFLQEHITGITVVQFFTAEERELKKFSAINAAHRNANIRSNWYYSVFFPFVEIISATAIGLLVWYCSAKIMNHEMQLGLLISFILCLNLLFRPIRMLADKFNTLQMGMVASDRVFKLLDQQIPTENPGMLDATNLKGEIEFSNVRFSYDGENEVLHGLSFHIMPGETVAIIGSTGSGKSTVISLINRLYEFQQGKIRIDKKNIHEYELHSLRKNIGVVLQDVFLFSGSILENITLQNDVIPRNKVIEAAKQCGVHDFIERLPGGYDYEVMERGATLSSGQRQLISFVRTFLYDPKILVLDEATSNIDSESERLIQLAIDKVVANRTSIIIAHRISTIKKADKILVIEKGELVESGTHRELMAFDSYYRKLYEMQFATEPLSGV